MVDDVLNSGAAHGSLAFPHPTASARVVEWTGGAFDCDDRQVRVLAYDISSSGWTDELTHLHEETGGSAHLSTSPRAATPAKRSCAVLRGPTTVLEIGCSSGFLLRELLAKLPGHCIVGADYTRDTLETLGTKLPNVPLLQFDLTRCPLADDFSDAIVLLNVLEHINDDDAAIAQLFRIVKPGGVVIIEVPASPSLFDVYDRVLMHHRRYTMRGLMKLAQRHGFVVEQRSHLGFILYPLFWLIKRLNQLRYPKTTDADERKWLLE